MTTFTRLLTAAALAPTLAAAPATAQSFSPAPSNGTISSVNLTLEEAIFISCDVSANYSVNASGQASLSNETFSPGSFFCGTLVQPTQNWAIETVAGSTSEVDLTIGFATFTGNTCSGVVRAPYDNAAGRIQLFNATIPSTTGGIPCRIDGDLFTSPRLEIVP